MCGLFLTSVLEAISLCRNYSQRRGPRGSRSVCGGRVPAVWAHVGAHTRDRCVPPLVSSHQKGLAGPRCPLLLPDAVFSWNLSLPTVPRRLLLDQGTWRVQQNCLSGGAVSNGVHAPWVPPRLQSAAWAHVGRRGWLPPARTRLQPPRACAHFPEQPDPLTLLQAAGQASCPRSLPALGALVVIVTWPVWWARGAFL